MKIKSNVDLGASFDRLKTQMGLIKSTVNPSSNGEDYARAYGALNSTIALHLKECAEDEESDPNDLKDVL
jgi:hypothetical protein